jgi:hypothetical protein
MREHVKQSAARLNQTPVSQRIQFIKNNHTNVLLYHQTPQHCLKIELFYCMNDFLLDDFTMNEQDE